MLRLPWDNEACREDWRLRLALLKENSRYRVFWQERGGDKVAKAQDDIQVFYRSLPNGGRGGLSKEEFSDYLVVCENPLMILQKFREGLHGFDIDGGELSSKCMEALDPFNPDIPEKLPFYFKGAPPIVQIQPESKDGPTEYRYGIPFARAKNLKPSERLFKIDLSRKKGELLKEFQDYLEAVSILRQEDDVPKGWKENYCQWEPDRSRFRKEAWQHLEIWKKIRREKRNFNSIAEEFGLSVDGVKKSFYRAFELIEGRPYDEQWKRYRDLHIEEIIPCRNCPEFSTCSKPCEKANLYCDQDEIAQRELTIGEAQYSNEWSEYPDEDDSCEDPLT